MIQSDLLGRLRLLAEAYRIPVGSVADRTAEITAPQPVTAIVEERLADGRYRVLAAGQRFDVDLPASTQPGDRVQVSVSAASSSRLAPLAQQQPADSVQSEVSGAGRMLAQLAVRAPDQNASGTITAARPLLPDAPLDTEVAAATLRELIALSGLFYESHQAEWVSGERDAQQLRREPQGRLPPPAQGQPPASAPATDSADAPLSAVGGAPAAKADGPAGRPLQLHPEAVALVQQQINTLEARHIVWNGEIWRGQPMQWEIEDSEQRAPGSAESMPVWRTRVDLRLPQLGAVTALITLGASGLGVRLSAASQSTDALFAQRLPELRGALLSAGLGVVEIGRQAYVPA